MELGTERRLGTGSMHDGLYYLDKNISPAVATVLSSSPLNEFLLQHRRLGHMSFATLGQLYPNLYSRINKDSLVCDACEFGKHTRSSYMSSDNRSTQPLHTIHSDVWGPSGVRSINGYRYFVTFIDCCTRTTWVYVLRHKSDVFECFRDFHNLIMNQYNACVKIFRTDNGTEYLNREFDEYLSSFGIIHQTTCPGTSEQNGLAERKNKHLLDVTRSLMFAMNVPKHLWSEAVMTAAYLINRMPLRVLGHKTPIECLTGKNSFVVPPKVFGCVCFVKDYRPSVGKLDPRALKCIFVGYSGKQKGYKCWCPAEKRMFISMDVMFRENESFYGEPTDLTDVFPDMFTSDVSDLDSEPGGDKEGENQTTTSREIIIGVIPRKDVHDDVCVSEGREQVQGEHQEEPNEAMRWPRFNEERNLQVYSRRHRGEEVEIPLRHDQEMPAVQAQEHTSPGRSQSDVQGSSPPNDGSQTISTMEIGYDGGDGST